MHVCDTNATSTYCLPRYYNIVMCGAIAYTRRGAPTKYCTNININFSEAFEMDQELNYMYNEKT